MDWCVILIITGCVVASCISLLFIVKYFKKLSAKWITTTYNTKDDSGFLIHSTHNCIVKQCFCNFSIFPHGLNKKFGLYFGISCEGFTKYLIVKMPFTFQRDYRQDYDTCIMEIVKGEQYITLTAKDSCHIEIGNSYMEMNSSIEFNNYYKKIMFPIYYPVLAGKSYHTTREIPHIYKGYIETIIYPKIEELEVSFKDEDKRFLPDIGNCFPTPHIVRDNSIIWITGRNLNHTDLYASFDNTVQKIGRERTDFIYGVIITALISLLLFFIQTLISLAVKTA